MLRRSLFLVAGLVVSALIVVGLIVGPGAGRGGDDHAAVRARTTTSTTHATTTGPTTTTTAPRRGSGQPVTFAFGGDVHFEGILRTKLQSDPGGMFSAIAPELSAADIAMVNLETAITDRGTPEPKQYNFRTSPSALVALHAAGVDVVTEANNHSRDYGAVGFDDTLAAKAGSPIPVLGIGHNATEASTPWQTVVHGQRIAVFGITDVLDDALISTWTASDTQAGVASSKGANQTRLEAAIRAVRSVSDTVVVYLHWGAEGLTCPTPRQQELAAALVAAGADIVVGSHAHRVAGGGRMGTAFVDYGLGNFAFYNESGAAGNTGVLNVTATGRDIDAYQWKPARIVNGVPRLLTGDAAAQASVMWESQRACTALSP